MSELVMDRTLDGEIIDGFHPRVLDAIRQKEQELETLKGWAGFTSDLIEAVERVRKPGWVSPTTNGLVLSFNVQHFEDVIDVARLLVARGFKFNTRTEYPPANADFQYFYQEHKFFVSLCTYLVDNAACVAVKVGEKTVPIYEFQCPEGEPALTQASAQSLAPASV
jgi:hypothetical protein